MSSSKPFVTILEHPAPKALRFRYECEGRSAGSIVGENSTDDNKTYPTIQVNNYTGRAIVVVSCVTKDAPYKPHPHNLVGREGCKKGVCKLEFCNQDMKMVFSNLGIQCVKKRDIEEALKVREEIRVDPFKTGFKHTPSSFNLGAVRLCFQVFTEGSTKEKFSVPLKPVVSNTIYDKKSTYDLVINKLSHCNAPCAGGQEMILLCEKVSKDDIEVRFFENKKRGWEDFGDFKPSEVHKQVAIFFRTPRFYDINIIEPVKIKLQLRCPSDGKTSKSLDFEILPLHKEKNYLGLKRQRSSDDAKQQFIKASPGHVGQDENPGLPHFDQTFGSLSPMSHFNIEHFSQNILRQPQNFVPNIVHNDANVLMPNILAPPPLFADGRWPENNLNHPHFSIEPVNTSHTSPIFYHDTLLDSVDEAMNEVLINLGSLPFYKL